MLGGKKGQIAFYPIIVVVMVIVMIERMGMTDALRVNVQPHYSRKE